MKTSRKTTKQARIDNIKVGDIVTVNKSGDTPLWEVVSIDGPDLMIKEHGRNYAPQLFPRSCVYDVVG